MAMGRVKYLKACSLRFMEWKAENLAPATRAVAMEILSKELNSLGCHVALREIKEQVARSIMNDDLEIVNDSLAFMVWDLTVNSGKAFNYSVSQNYFAGLLQQVRNVLYTNSRASMTMITGGRELKISSPTIVKDKIRGAVEIAKLSPSRLSDLAEEFILENKTAMIRWKAMGADPAFVIKTLKKLVKVTLAVYTRSEAVVSITVDKEPATRSSKKAA